MLRAILVMLVWSGTAMAEAPRVVVDIAPVHSLVAGVMAGVGEPVLLLPADASPHDFALRPSDARQLAEADHMVWVGEALTPRLAQQLAAVSDDAGVTTLLGLPGWAALDARDGDDGHDGDDWHDGDDGHDGHDGVDPHGWLDPQIAAVWVAGIADDLAQMDPANAAVYRANAARMAVDFEMLSRDIMALMQGVKPFVWPHDGYQYFEARFGIAAVGAVAPSDDAPPGPAHLATLRAAVAAGEIDCLLYAAGPAPGWVATLSDGVDVQVGQVDLIGVELTPGIALYPTLITQLAQDVLRCAGG